MALENGEVLAALDRVTEAVKQNTKEVYALRKALWAETELHPDGVASVADSLADLGARIRDVNSKLGKLVELAAK